jgi:hypothetical protein
MSERVLTSGPAMLPLFARAGLAMVPGASRLPFVGGGGGEIPDQALTCEDVGVDRGRLTAYDRVCGFDVSDTLPPTYPHMLAFPMHLALMTDGRFPLPAIGLVHIANAITVHRPIQASERLSLRVWATPIEPHPRGRQFTIRTEARVGDRLSRRHRPRDVDEGPVPGGAGPAAERARPVHDHLRLQAANPAPGDGAVRGGGTAGRDRLRRACRPDQESAPRRRGQLR